MTATTLPHVTLQWHGINDYGTHDVALSGTVRAWLVEMPEGTEFTVQEATDHFLAAQAGASEEYSQGIWQESSQQSDIDAMYYELDGNKLVECLSDPPYAFSAEMTPVLRYRKT